MTERVAEDLDFAAMPAGAVWQDPGGLRPPVALVCCPACGRTALPDPLPRGVLYAHRAEHVASESGRPVSVLRHGAAGGGRSCFVKTPV